MLRRLRPQGGAMPEGVPLKRLLADLVQSWHERPGRRAEYSLRYALDDRAVSGDLALALYRLTQEALTNAARHADASRVAVRLDAAADGAIEWCVEDDGIGLDSAEAAHRGHGLAGMRERVWAHGGEIEMGPLASSRAERAGLRIRARFRAPETAHA